MVSPSPTSIQERIPSFSVRTREPAVWMKKSGFILEEDMIGGGVRHQSVNDILIAINALCQIFDGGSLARKIPKDLQADQCQYTDRSVTLKRLVGLKSVISPFYLPIQGYPRVLGRLRDHVAHRVSPGA